LTKYKIQATYEATKLQAEAVTDVSELETNVVLQYTSPEAWNRLGSKLRGKMRRRSQNVVSIVYFNIICKQYYTITRVIAEYVPTTRRTMHFYQLP